MFFHLDINGLPIYEQIVRQVKFAVAAKTLRSGEMVPSVRETAKDLAINPNTVARAYRELQNERILEPVRGTGLAVAQGALTRCRTERLALVRARLQQAIGEARQAGLASAEIAALVEEELGAVEREAAAEPE